MTSAWILLALSALTRIAAGTLPPLLGLLITHALTIQALAGCMIAAALVRVSLAPIAGPWVDAAAPFRLVVRCEMAFGAACALMVWAFHLGVAGFWHWLFFFAVGAAIQAVEEPAASKLTLRVIGKQQLAKFMGWESAVLHITRLGGPVLAGIALLAWPSESALMLFLLVPPLLTVPAYAALWFWRGRLLPMLSDEKAVDVQAGRPRTFRHWVSEVAAGFRARWSIRTERYLAIQVFLELAVIVPSFGILLPQVVVEHQWADSWLGWLEAASGAGLVIGSLSAPRIMQWRGRWATCIAAAFALALGALACGASTAAQSPSLLAWSLFGSTFALACRMQVGAAQRRVAIPDRMRARFMGVHMTLNALAAQLGVAAAAVWLSARPAAGWYFACAAVLVGLAVALAFIPGLKVLVSMEVADADGYYERRYPEAFAVS